MEQTIIIKQKKKFKIYTPGTWISHGMDGSYTIEEIVYFEGDWESDESVFELEKTAKEEYKRQYAHALDAPDHVVTDVYWEDIAKYII